MFVSPNDVKLTRYHIISWQFNNQHIHLTFIKYRGIYESIEKSIKCSWPKHAVHNLLWFVLTTLSISIGRPFITSIEAGFKNKHKNSGISTAHRDASMSTLRQLQKKYDGTEPVCFVCYQPAYDDDRICDVNSSAANRRLLPRPPRLMTSP